MFDDVPTNYDSPVHHNKLNSMPQASSAPSFFFFNKEQRHKQTNKKINKQTKQRGQNKSKLIRTPSHYCSMKLIIMDWKSMYKNNSNKEELVKMINITALKITNLICTIP